MKLTDGTGNTTDSYQYNAYGLLTNHSGNSSTPFLYNGQYGIMTDGNGLCYMRARYYNPEVRRFISSDSIEGDISNPLSLNLYTYCNNNPINYIDPTGNIYVIAWSYGNEVNDYKGSEGNVDWDRFTKESSFARAAYTIRQNLIDSGVPETEIDVQRVDSVEDLRQTWKMWAGYQKIDGMDIFGHASNTSGLVTPDPESSTDFWMNKDLNVLNWVEGAEAIFHGCYTAPYAQVFANRQGAITYGQAGDANLSSSPYVHIPIWTGGTSLGVYLYDYETYVFPYEYNCDGEGVMYLP